MLIKCGTGPGFDDVCGITNDANADDGTPGAIDPVWRTDIGVNGFYEAGINLTKLSGETFCFAMIMIETRSSTSLTATLKDFTFLGLSNCIFKDSFEDP